MTHRIGPSLLPAVLGSPRFLCAMRKWAVFAFPGIAGSTLVEALMATHARLREPPALPRHLICRLCPSRNELRSAVAAIKQRLRTALWPRHGDVLPSYIGRGQH